MRLAPGQQRNALVAPHQGEKSTQDDVIKFAQIGGQQIGKPGVMQLNVRQGELCNLLLTARDVVFIDIDANRQAVWPGQRVGNQRFTLPAPQLQDTRLCGINRISEIKRGRRMESSRRRARGRVNACHDNVSKIKNETVFARAQATGRYLLFSWRL
ncbi:hypothetical protein D3C78_757210 [compost metagenome]